jgi:hypothetical protein
MKELEKIKPTSEIQKRILERIASEGVSEISAGEAGSVHYKACRTLASKYPETFNLVSRTRKNLVNNNLLVIEFFFQVKRGSK